MLLAHPRQKRLADMQSEMEVRPEVDALLKRELPGLLGVVGTNSQNGFPHLVPVWFRWDGALVRSCVEDEGGIERPLRALWS